MKPRAPRRRVDGVLLLDKPLGLSSNHALQRVKRFFQAERAGHTGTLDPLATGLLPIALGEATKFSQGLLEADKGYQTTLKLGVTTTTGDAEGAVVRERAVAVSATTLDAVIARFRGNLMQVPPMYSALKRDGEPLYAYARRGETVERAPRAVTIHQLEVMRLDGDQLDLAVLCSKGTYIRTLAEDIGEELGCGAHLMALRRDRVGALTLAGAHRLEEIEAASLPEIDTWLHPVDSLVMNYPSVTLIDSAAARISHGQPVPNDAAASTLGPVRIYAPSGRFLGLATATVEGRLEPLRLIAESIL